MLHFERQTNAIGSLKYSFSLITYWYSYHIHYTYHILHRIIFFISIIFFTLIMFVMLYFFTQVDMYMFTDRSLSEIMESALRLTAR